MLRHSKVGIVPQLVNQYNDIIESIECQTIQLNQFRNNSIECDCIDESVGSVTRDPTCDNSLLLTNKESINASQNSHKSVAVEEDRQTCNPSDSQENKEFLGLNIKLHLISYCLMNLKSISDMLL